MPRYTVGLKGLEETVRGFQNLGEASKKRIVRNASRAGATEMQKALKGAAPVGDVRSKASEEHGRLSKNIKVEQLKAGGEFLPYYLVTTGKAFWGWFLDMGTKHIRPGYWFRNCVEITRPAILKKMVEGIRNSLVREIEKMK